MIGQSVRMSDEYLGKFGCYSLAGMIGRITKEWDDMVLVLWPETGVTTGGTRSLFDVHSPITSSTLVKARDERIAKSKRELFIRTLLTRRIANGS